MKKTVLSLTAILSASFLFSQEALKSTEEEYYDFLSLQGIVERPTLGYRTLSDSEWKFIEKEVDVVDEDGNPLTDEAGNKLTNLVMPDHPWQNNNLGTKRTLWQGQEGSNWFTRGFDHSLKFKLYGPEWYNSFNTAAPYGQNDGALWQGKGYNSSLTGGARLEAYGFELTLKPQVSFSQNLAFDTLGGVYGNNYGAFFGQPIDLVERYGDSAFWNFDWGDTEIRYTWRTLTFGAGTQSPWLGASWLNPMLGSNNAATYPKIDAGLRKTKVYLPFCNWYIGDVEGRIWVGRLTNSDYFDASPNYKDRMVTAMSASYSPSFIPGFTFGLNRIFMTKWSARNLLYITRLFTKSGGNASGTGNDEDQKFAFFADFHYPSIGFEIFGEFGRDDFCCNESTNPFRTAIYTVGAKKTIPIHLTKLFPKWKNLIDLNSELIFEWSNSEMSHDFQFEYPYLGYYAHGAISQGYTNKGQIIGAGSGQFGNSQFLGWRIYYPKGSSMLFFHRFNPNNNSIYSKTVNSAANTEIGKEIYEKWHENFEAYYVLGVNTTYFPITNLGVTLGLNYINIVNRHYEKDVSEKNINIFMNIKYSF